MEETRKYTTLMEPQDTQDAGVLRARRRLLWFGLHLVGYFILMAGIFLVTLSDNGVPTRFVIVLVGWGSVLALHAAFVMGLFRIFSDRND